MQLKDAPTRLCSSFLLYLTEKENSELGAAFCSLFEGAAKHDAEAHLNSLLKSLATPELCPAATRFATLVAGKAVRSLLTTFGRSDDGFRRRIVKVLPFRALSFASRLFPPQAASLMLFGVLLAQPLGTKSVLQRLIAGETSPRRQMAGWLVGLLGEPRFKSAARELIKIVLAQIASLHAVLPAHEMISICQQALSHFIQHMERRQDLSRHGLGVDPELDSYIHNGIQASFRLLSRFAPADKENLSGLRAAMCWALQLAIRVAGIRVGSKVNDCLLFAFSSLEDGSKRAIRNKVAQELEFCNVRDELRRQKAQFKKQHNSVAADQLHRVRSDLAMLQRTNLEISAAEAPFTQQVTPQLVRILQEGLWRK